MALSVRNALSIALIVVILFLAITVEYFVTLGPMVVGRIDHLLLSKPCCGTDHAEIQGGNDDPSPSPSPGSILTRSVQLDMPFNYILWKAMTQFLTRYRSPSCDSVFGISSECRQSLDQEYCRICETYQKYRCHFRADELLLHRHPWRNECHVRNASLHSTSECTFPPFPPPNRPPSVLADLLLRDQPTNVLRTNVTSRADGAYHSTALDAQPAVEVRDLSANWRSTFRPVVDVNASGVVVHLVVGHGGVPLDVDGVAVAVPTVWLGNSTLEEVVDAVPVSTEEGGLYPRLGIVNITGVTVVVHSLIDGSFGEDGRSVPTSEVAVPDELFLPLLQVTIDAGKEGTDRIVLSSMLKEAAIMAVRRHVLGEEKLRASFHKSAEILDAVRSAVIGHVRRGSDVVNEHLDRATDGVKGLVNNLEEEWRAAVRDDQNQLWKPLFGDVKEGWNEIKRGLREKDGAGAVLMDSAEEEMGRQWKHVQKEAAQGWGNMKHKLFDKMSEINDDWKKAQVKAEDSVSPVVSLLGEAFFANNN